VPLTLHDGSQLEMENHLVLDFSLSGQPKRIQGA
jgi:hypothetical protein